MSADSENDREPAVITQRDCPVASLLEADSCESLQRRAGILEGIVRGERAVEEGHILTHDQAKERLARWKSAPPADAASTGSA